MIKTLQKSDVKLLLSGVNSSVLQDLKKHGVASLIGDENILDSFDKALKHAKEITVALP